MNPAALPGDSFQERRLRRERNARLEAERLLTEKSRELYDALNAANEMRERLELALWASGRSIWEWRLRGDTLRCETFHEGTPLVGDTPLRLRSGLLPRIHPNDREHVAVAWRMIQRSDTDLDCEFRLHDAGRFRWVHARGRAIKRRPSDGHALVIVGTVKDISDRRDAQQQQRIIANALAVAREPIAVTTRDWVLLHANEAFTELTGLDPNDTPRSLLEQLPLQRLLGDAADGTAVRQGQLTMRDRRGAERQVEATVTPLTGSDADVHTNYIVSLRPLTVLRDATVLKLMKLSTLDASTGLPNRMTMTHHLEARLALLDEDSTFALLQVSLTEWRQLIDAFGQTGIEALLQQYVRQIEHSLHPQDVLGRWADDTLMLLLRPGSGAAQADRLARNIIGLLCVPQQIDGLPVTVPVNIGISIAPTDGDSASTLVRRADSAAYAAKELGHNAFEFFRPALDVDGFTRLHMLSLLRGAGDRGEFEFLVQPKVNESLAIVGGELLIRWYSEHYGPVSPTLFIPLAEESEVIYDIGALAAKNACALVAALNQRGERNVPIAINVSARQVSERGLEFMLLAACEKAGVEPWMLELELTESVLLDQLDNARQLIHRLRSHGFRLALDDFGTGYSSLTYLRELPFDRVKIDRSFVRDIGEDERAKALLDGIVTMCRALGTTTVAEGIETEAQYQHLRDMGVDEFQGFWFHRPMPQSDLVRLLGKPSHPAEDRKPA